MGAITGTMLAVGAGLGLAGAAAGMGLGAMMSKDKGTGQMQMPQAPAVPKMEDASKMAQLRADERKRAMARSKSVVSNPLGVQDQAQVARKTLLGG